MLRASVVEEGGSFTGEHEEQDNEEFWREVGASRSERFDEVYFFKNVKYLSDSGGSRGKGDVIVVLTIM